MTNDERRSRNEKLLFALVLIIVIVIEVRDQAVIRD